MGKIWGFQAFWSCSVDFPQYSDPLAENGHIWGFWALSGERVGVNVEGRGRRHISDALHRVLSSINLQGCFRLCDWLSFWCLVPWINHYHPVYWSTFLQI